MKRFSLLSILVIFSTLFFTSCNSTRILSSWSLENPPSNVMDRVLVLGVIQNRETREQIEREMTASLSEAGVNANSATSVFGPKGFKGMTEDEITKKLQDSEFSSVMILSLVDKEKEQIYSPGSSYASPRVIGYSRYYRRYIVAYDRIYTPGYYRTNVSYVLEADLYTVNDDDALVYSAQTRSYDPRDRQSLAREFAKSIVSELKIKGLIR